MNRPESLMQDVAPEHAFHVHGGGDIRNVYRFRDALIEMSDATFHHHVTKDRNDFKSWVHDVLGDAEFAAQLSRKSSRISMLAAVNKYIKGHEKRHRKNLCEMSRHIHCGMWDFAGGVVLGLIVGLAVARMIF